MATLVYDKKGKEFKVVHPIDVQGWLDDGYALKKPTKAGAGATAPKPAQTAEKE